VAEPEARIVRIQSGMGSVRSPACWKRRASSRTPINSCCWPGGKVWVRKSSGVILKYAPENLPDGAGLFNLRQNPVETGDHSEGFTSGRSPSVWPMKIWSLWRTSSLGPGSGLADRIGPAGEFPGGFLFPDTYFFHRGMPVRAMQKRMVNRFRKSISGVGRMKQRILPPV